MNKKKNCVSPFYRHDWNREGHFYWLSQREEKTIERNTYVSIMDWEKMLVPKDFFEAGVSFVGWYAECEIRGGGGGL